MRLPHGAIILAIAGAVATATSLLSVHASPPPAKPAPVAPSPLEEISVAEQFESARAMLQRWSETQALIAREQRDWQQGKMLLQQRMELIEQEIAATKLKIDEARKTLDQNKTEKEKVMTETEAAVKNSEVLKREIPSLEEKVRLVYAQVPVQVQEKAKTFYTSIQSPEGADKLVLAARYMSVVSLATLFGKSNTEVFQGPQTIVLPDGQTAEVNVIYFGLGQAYYINKNGSEAGTGKPTPTGWVWKKETGIADRLVQMLEVLKKSGAPHIIPLPARIE